MEATKMTCPRCRGKGFISSPVVYAGAPGNCFFCAGDGETYKDKFFRFFGVGQRFVGMTRRVYLNADNPNNGVFKSVVTLKSFKHAEFDAEALLASGEFTPVWGGTVRLVEITEEQARAFVKQFGYDARVRREGETTQRDNPLSFRARKETA